MTKLDYAAILDEVTERARGQLGQGTVANYIPALAAVDPSKLGVALRTVDGSCYSVGDAREPFSIQSVAKLFLLTMALEIEGDQLWKRVGREPSGNPFNSLVQLEYEHGIPRNPFINAGALVLTDILVAHLHDAKAELLAFIRRLAGNDGIVYDGEVAASERAWGDRNAALAHFLKSFGNLQSAVEPVLDMYVHACALAMSCEDLATASGFLATGGLVPKTREQVISIRQSKRINALLLTCGMYDVSGDFAYRVGIPAKSGVGGGIVGSLPAKWTISVWSPELNAAGNSLVGTRVLELFTTMTQESIF